EALKRMRRQLAGSLRATVDMYQSLLDQELQSGSGDEAEEQQAKASARPARGPRPATGAAERGRGLAARTCHGARHRGAQRGTGDAGGDRAAGGSVRAGALVGAVCEWCRQPRQAFPERRAAAGGSARPPERSPIMISPIRWDGSGLRLLDQTLLPREE